MSSKTLFIGGKAIKSINEYENEHKKYIVSLIEKLIKKERITKEYIDKLLNGETIISNEELIKEFINIIKNTIISIINKGLRINGNDGTIIMNLDSKNDLIQNLEPNEKSLGNKNKINQLLIIANTFIKSNNYKELYYNLNKLWILLIENNYEENDENKLQDYLSKVCEKLLMIISLQYKIY